MMYVDTAGPRGSREVQNERVIRNRKGLWIPRKDTVGAVVAEKLNSSCGVNEMRTPIGATICIILC